MQPIDLRSPSVLLRFVAEMRTQVDDLWGACDDATRPPSKRALGRSEARRLAADAYRAINQMLDSALLGLGEMPPADHLVPSGEPGPSCSPPPSSQRRPK